MRGGLKERGLPRPSLTFCLDSASILRYCISAGVYIKMYIQADLKN